MMKLALMLSTAALLVGCAFDTSNPSNGFGGTDASTAVDAEGGAQIDAAVFPSVDAGGGSADAAPPLLSLISDSVLVRYFLDEAPSGVVPMLVLDAIADPLHLEIQYEDGDSYVVENGNRGLRFNSAQTDPDMSGAYVSVVAGSKLHQLHDRQKATLEMVVRLTEAKNNARIADISDDQAKEKFSLMYKDGKLLFKFNNNVHGRWGFSELLPVLERTVLHVVVDTTLDVKKDRVKLYVDGVLQVNEDGGPNKNLQLDLGDSSVFVLGNHDAQDRPYQGTFFYSAIYTKALSAEEVTHNVGILSDNDDNAGFSGQ